MHFDLDPIKTEDLTRAWRDLGLTRLPLDIVECPDRRIPRAALELVATEIATGDTEVSILVPRRQYTHVWHRLLHDRTADAIAQALSFLPHSNVTIVPYHLGSQPDLYPPTDESPSHTTDPAPKRDANTSAIKTALAGSALPADRTPIANVEYRQRARIAGRVHTMRVQPHAGVGSLECTLVDDTGGIALVFLGRRSIAGIKVGTRIAAEGTIGEERGRLAILNPAYEILPDQPA